MISLDRELFKSIYADTKVLKDIDIFYATPSSDIDLIENYLPSKLWRLNNIYKIVNKQGPLVNMDMTVAQHRVYAATLKHPRLIILKSRQQGISTLFLVSYFDDCITLPNLNSGLMAQGNQEAETLLTRTKILWSTLDPGIKEFFNIDIDKNNTREFRFNNNSCIFVRNDFRSSTLHRLHISEFGKIANQYPERARKTKTGTLQAIAPGNTAIIESTAEGQNLFKTMWDTSVGYAGEVTLKDFKPVFLSWIDDPDCSMDKLQEIDGISAEYFKNIESELNCTLKTSQKNFWIAQRRELGVDIHQEYPATPTEAFLKNRDGTYYAALYLSKIKRRQREAPDLFDASLPVEVAIDLGTNDYTVLIYFQTWSDGWRVIDCYYNMHQGIEHYCNIMTHAAKLNGYNISRLLLPHDSNVKDMTSNISRASAFRKFGYKDYIILDRTKSLLNDIERVRQAMEHMWIDTKAQYIIDCLLNYTKEWDLRREVWNDKPCHNLYSHGADALRYMVLGGTKYVSQEERYRQKFLDSPSGFQV